MKKLGLYIHIPFCERKCNYCDFYSLRKTNEIEDKYMQALCQEIDSYKDITSDYMVETIFIGGGTPSYLKPENIGIILDKIKNDFLLSDDVEITMEANPNSITLDKAKMYKEFGINRISIGVQSLDNKILKLIGRLHNAEEAIKAIKILKAAGYYNINTDVIFNIPGQNVDNIKETLKKLIDEDVEHISFYSLKLEEGTPMYNMERNGEIELASDEEERNMYYEGRSYMRSRGFHQYEISNFCKKNFECKHNIKYWTGGEYIGFGPFAHSFFQNSRYNNISDIKMYCNYIENPDKFRCLNEVLDKDAMIFEFIMLRLRMNNGFTLKEFNDKFNCNFDDLYKVQLLKLMKYELISCEHYNNGHIRLTEKGMDVSNYVFEEFM